MRNKKDMLDTVTSKVQSSYKYMQVQVKIAQMNLGRNENKKYQVYM